MANNGSTATVAAPPAVTGVSLIAMQEQMLKLMAQMADITSVKTPATPAPPTPPASLQPAPAKRTTRKPKPETEHTISAQAAAVKVDAALDAYQERVGLAHDLIRRLRQVDGKSKGVHTVFSGFTLALGAKYVLTNEQVYKLVDLMVERGDLQRHPCRRGYMVYVPGDMPRQQVRDGKAILASLGL